MVPWHGILFAFSGNGYGKSLAIDRFGISAPGDTVMLTILRGGEQLEIEVTLDKRPR